MSSLESIRLTVVTPSDPAAPPIGGIATFLSGMIRHAPADFEMSWIGTSRDTSARPVGRWTSIQIHGQEIDVLPLLAHGGEQRRRVPISLQFGAQLLRQRRLLAKRGGILQFHRPGVPIALLGIPGPKVQVLHLHPAAVGPSGGESRWRHAPWLFRLSEQLVIRNMDAVFGVNESVVDGLRRKYPQRANRIHFLPNWFDPEFFHRDLRERQELDDPPVVIFVGRLERTKDPQLALEAFGHLVRDGTKARLVVVGDGTLRNQLAELAAQPRLAGHVELAGSRSQLAVGDLLRRARVLIISSRNEAGPTVALEALASGVPVVAPSVGRINRLVDDRATGWIARERSPAALADGLRWALAQERSVISDACVAAAAPYSARHILEPFYTEHRRLARAARPAQPGRIS